MTPSRRQEAHVGRPFGENRLLQMLLAAYAVVFPMAAIGPHDRGDWLLENLLVLLFAPVLALTHRRIPTSLRAGALDAPAAGAVSRVVRSQARR